MALPDAALADQLLGAWPDHVRRHVSPSSITMFLRCPEQWRWRYIQDKKEPPGAALVLGVAHHQTIEANFKQKIETLVDLPIAEIKDRFSHLFDTEIEARGGEGEIDWRTSRGADEKHTTAGELRDVGIGLAGAYHTYAAPRVIPLAVEREFEIPVEGLPATIKGRIDLEASVLNPLKPALPMKASDECRLCGRTIELDGMYVRERGICSWCAGDMIVDHKTAGKDQLQPDNRLKAAIYQIERPLPVDFHISVKTKVPKIVTGKYVIPVVPRERTLAILQGAMRQIAFNLAVYGPDDPWPTHAITDSWACGYCGFFDRCAWQQREPWEKGGLF